MRLIILLPLFFVGCGNAKNSPTAPTSKWTTAQIDQTVSVCVKGTDPANTPDPRVTKYCQCIYQEAAMRWTFEDYSSRKREYETILDKEVSPACEKNALGIRRVRKL